MIRRCLQTDAALIRKYGGRCRREERIGVNTDAIPGGRSRFAGLSTPALGCHGTDAPRARSAASLGVSAGIAPIARAVREHVGVATGCGARGCGGLASANGDCVRENDLGVQGKPVSQLSDLVIVGGNAAVRVCL